MKRILAAAMLLPGVALAQPAPPAGPFAMPPDSVALPVEVARALAVYLADRSSIAANLQAAVTAAMQAKPQLCPAPAAAKP